MELNSSKVSWLSLLVVVAVVIGLGLVGNRQIVNSLQDQFLSHAIAHSREAADSLLPLLQDPLRAGLPHPEIVARFQSSLTQVHGLTGYSVSLVDAERGTVLASSSSGKINGTAETAHLHPWLVRTVADLRAGLLAHPWVIREEAGGGRVVLTYFTPVMETASASRGWYLAVRSDIIELIDTMHDLHYRLSGMLLLTAGLIATAGFLLSRWIGRSYERYLEDTVRERTAQWEAAHAEMLLKARLATLGQTASMLAHEIRNPLASIKMGLSGLVSAGYLRERDSRRVHIALREVDRLDEMLTDALNYARPVKLSREPLSLDRLVDGVLPLAEPALLERRLLLRRTACPECPGIRMDVNQMEQVLLNLLNNAIEASPEGGCLDIAVSVQDSWLCLDVANAGPPIPPGEIGKLFEPFYTTKPKGTGLGLMLVKRVVEEHGGEVLVTSSASTGTHVGFRLPVRPNASEAAPASE